MLESLQAIKYHCRAWLKSLARPASEKLGANNIDSVLDHRRNERFLKDRFLLTAVHGRHSRSFLQKHAKSGQYSSATAGQRNRFTLIRAPYSKVHTNHELLEPNGSAKMLPGLVFRNRGLTTVIRSLSQYSQTFNSSFDVFFREASVADTETNLILCWLVQCAVESTYCRYVRFTKLLHCFPKALRLFGKLNDENASEDFSAPRNVFGVTHLDSAGLSSAFEHNALLYIRRAAAHTARRKQNAILNGRTFYSNVASFFQELRGMQGTAFKAHRMNFDEFLLFAIPATETFLPPVKKMYLTQCVSASTVR